MKKLLISISFTLICFLGVAQKIATDRPDQTESSAVVPSGSFQIESGILVGFTDNNNNSEEQLLLPSTLFRIAIVKGVELRIISQFERIKNTSIGSNDTGISDLEVGTKIQLLQKEDSNSEIAFLTHVVLPTGSKSLTSNRFGTINKLAVSHSLSDKIGLGYNVGYNFLGNNNGDMTYSLSLTFSISDKLGVYAEPYGALIDLKNHESNFDAGLTYLLQDNFQLDFSFGTGINNTMNYIAVGASINIK